MKNARQKKRRRRPRASDPVAKAVEANEKDEKSKVNELSETFSLASLDDAVSAYREANSDPERAAYGAEDPSTSSSYGSSSSSGSGSGSSEGFVEAGFVENVMNGKGLRGSKQKRIIAVTGTVSTVLGKDYVKASPCPCPRSGWAKSRGFSNEVVQEVDAEQFLCSMLGDECELSLAVVRDVLCQCEYNVEKALDALLELSAPTFEQYRNGSYLDNSVNHNEDIRFLIERKDSFTDVASDCTSRSSESDVQDSIWSVGHGFRSYAKVLTSPEADFPTSARRNESNLPQKVLESLFNVSKSPEYVPKTMNWRNVVKKLQLLGPGFDVCPSSVTELQQDTCAKGEEYHAFRKSSKQHWDSMRSYYQKAAVTFSKGEREYAAYLSEQGKVQTKLARKADEKARHDIFKARNEDIENVITIDLHGQHVKQAMQYVKALILLGTYVPSIQTLRVITGCGSHGVGKAKVKQSVIKLMQKEGIEWSEENQGTLLIKLNGYREFSFMDSDSDTE
ncbi:SMR domain-containing protein At5g58720 [Corylus avellana]|uniref:SMR domain-containing protein At5g58720 n=1 Tax=Corylus avellana TaxID=13451 RepID=UPI00286A6B7E|nr:SMR domain-containing protein At5g58720 [Corylus avellana]